MYKLVERDPYLRVMSLSSHFGRLLSTLPTNNRMERIWKLAQIDFKRRYYNDRLGLIWALINPLLQIAVYYFVFTHIFGSREENFVSFLFCGLLVWGVFAETTKGAIGVLRQKRYLIENIQFDKKDLFISQTLSVFMGFAFNMMVYFVVAGVLGATYNINVLYFVPVLITLFMISMAMGMILAIAFILLDDVRHLWDILIFVGFWVSGILYSPDRITDAVPFAEYINPFLGILKNTRTSVLYGTPPDYEQLLYNLGFSLLLYVIALWFFRKHEHLILERR